MCLIVHKAWEIQSWIKHALCPWKDYKLVVETNEEQNYFHNAVSTLIMVLREQKGKIYLSWEQSSWRLTWVLKERLWTGREVSKPRGIYANAWPVLNTSGCIREKPKYVGRTLWKTYYIQCHGHGKPLKD